MTIYSVFPFRLLFVSRATFSEGLQQPTNYINLLRSEVMRITGDNLRTSPEIYQNILGERLATILDWQRQEPKVARLTR